RISTVLTRKGCHSSGHQGGRRRDRRHTDACFLTASPLWWAHGPRLRAAPPPRPLGATPMAFPRRAAAAVLTLGLATGLTACADDESRDRNDLVGTWVLVEFDGADIKDDPAVT